MKKGHFIKQDVDELLIGEITNEDCAVFKAYYQLKAHCFKKELKETYLSYKQAVRIFSEEIINVLISEEYIYRYNENERDYIIVPEISDNVYEIQDYSKINSISGKISAVKKKIKKLQNSSEDTSELNDKLRLLEIELIDEKGRVNERINTRSTIENNRKEDIRAIKNDFKLNNPKQLKIKSERDLERIELIKQSFSNDV